MTDRPLKDAVAADRTAVLESAAAHAEGVFHLLDKAGRLRTSTEPADHRRAVMMIERATGLLPEVLDTVTDEQGRAVCPDGRTGS